MTRKIDVIIPVYNEADILLTFYERIRALPLSLNLIFIDNASTDQSLAILKALPDITVIPHSRNEGYGGSIQTGLAQSTADIIVIIDADCEYPPESLPALIEALNSADVVYASRFLTPGAATRMPFIKKIGNQVITACYNFLFTQHLTDLYTGCKAIKRSALDNIRWKRKGFEHVLEMGVRLAQKGVRIKEVQVTFAARATGHSKMRHIPETLKFLFLLFHYYIESQRTLVASNPQT